MTTPPPDQARRAARDELIARLLLADNELDMDALVEVFPHPRFELIGTNKVYDGRTQVEHHLRERRAAFPDYRSELIATYHSDDAVIAEVWLHGTQLGPIEHIPPSGKAFRCRLAVFFLFRGDTLVCERIYFDQGTIARQLA